MMTHANWNWFETVASILGFSSVIAAIYIVITAHSFIKLSVTLQRKNNITFVTLETINSKTRHYIYSVNDIDIWNIREID